MTESFREILNLYVSLERFLICVNISTRHKERKQNQWYKVWFEASLLEVHKLYYALKPCKPEAGCFFAAFSGYARSARNDGHAELSFFEQKIFPFFPVRQKTVRLRVFLQSNSGQL